MEQAATEISRSFYADYGALAVLVLANIAALVLMYRYFAGEVRACLDRRELSENGWKERYDELVERMMTQMTTQATVLERMADKQQKR
jgi:hypothetical protein